MAKVILLPGMDGSGVMFEPLKELIPEKINFEVVSLISNGDQSYSLQAEYIAKTIGDDEVILFAESYSGYLALLVYNLKPKNIRHIIFAASFLTNPNRLTKLVSLLPASIFRIDLIPTVFLNFVCFSNSAHPGVIDCLKRSLQTVSANTLKQRLKNISNLKSAQYEIEIPCTYILPSNDYLISKRAIGHIQTTCKNLHVINLKGGHFIAQSNVAGCAQVISDVVAL